MPSRSRGIVSWARTVRDGVRFGLLLQLAVGPVFLFVFQTGSERDVGQGLLAASGVALVDALYIALAGLGVTRWAESGRARRALQYGGAAIVALFGVHLIASGLGVKLIPSALSLPHAGTGASGFLAAVVLTGSNPLTIVFWAGVFSARVAAERYTRKQLWLFSVGCIAATVAFLGATALAGALLGRVAPAIAVRVLNVAVGCALLYLAARGVLPKAARDSAVPVGA